MLAAFLALNVRRFGQVIRLQNTMKTRATRLIAASLAALMTAGVAATPAIAMQEGKLDRNLAMKRAKTWVRKRVNYSQVRTRGGYRRDCSGLVSYAWDLPENLTTWRIPSVARKIPKRRLQKGDVLLNASGGVGGRHVVIFEKWANRKKTAYIGIEQTGANGIERAVRRKLPYPYKFDKKLYKPYRYVGMSGYYKKFPRKQRQPVRGYSGRVITPSVARANRKAAAVKAARIEKAQAAKKAAEAAKKAAEIEAAKKAAAQAAAEKIAAEKARKIAAARAEKAAREAERREALSSPGAAVRYVARESAQTIVATIVGSLRDTPLAR